MTLTRLRDFSEKKTKSVAAARITAAELTTGFQDVFKIPRGSFIDRVTVIATVVSGAGAALDVRINSGSTTVDRAGFGVSTANKPVVTGWTDASGNLTNGGPASDPIDAVFMFAETGATVQVQKNNSVNATGEFVIIVDYIEPDLSTGSLTNI